MANLPVVTPNPIPTFKQPITDDTDLTTRPWYFFFQSLYNNILKPTGVTPGSYTSTNLTVNANGVITAASNGSGGGGALTVTDGTNTVTPATKVTFTGATVSGTTPNAVVTVPAANQFNITVDSHGPIPTGVGVGPNDEFEAGSTIDTGGTRYTGATGWTAFNLGTGSTSVLGGSLVFAPQVGAGVNYSGYTQPVPATGDWSYVMKISAAQVTTSQLVGMLLATSSGPSGHIYLFGISSTAVTAQRATNSTTFSSNPAVGVINGFIGTAGSAAGSTLYFYVQIAWVSATSTLTMSVSGSGLPGTFSTIITELSSAFLGTPALIGVGAENQASAHALAVVDWFRRVV